MATAGRINFHTRVLLSVLALCWALAGTVMVFQYCREKEFKAELLDARLQAINARILADMRQGDDIADISRRITAEDPSLRLTLIARDGSVIFDNNDLTPFPTGNHNGRPEIAAARAAGLGRATERHSESDDADYFYSARLGDAGTVVRTAAPYSHSLREVLRADGTLLWLMAALTLGASVLAYLLTRRISQSLERLERFAGKAEKGEPIFDDEAFPDDELGSIAGHIVRLYVQRDRRHHEALRQEQEKVRIKKQLTNNINHELKTPVASMLVCLELLRDHPELPAHERERFMQRAVDAARRLNALLKDVAAITRMDEGAHMIEKEPLDLAAIIREVAADTRLRTTMEVRVDIPDALPVAGNRRLLESVFRNLADNSIAYSGGSMLSISADAEGNICVRDDGAGVPAEHLPHIFERFYRVDKGRSREAGGTGLGLSIVRNAVALHGGSITASHDGGLRFDFHIPPSGNSGGQSRGTAS